METKKRYKFKINTSNICFLCFGEFEQSSKDLSEEKGDSVRDNQNADNFNSNRVVSIQNILQYLKMDLKQIPSLSKRSTSLLNKTDFRVSVCDHCESEVNKFTTLCESLKLIKMKMEFSLEGIRDKLKHSKINLKERYQDKIKESSEASPSYVAASAALKHSKIVEELRHEMVQRCDSRKFNFQPQLQLERLTEDEYLSHERKLKERLYPTTASPSDFVNDGDYNNSEPLSPNQDDFDYETPSAPHEESPEREQIIGFQLTKLDLDFVAATNLQLEQQNVTNCEQEVPKKEEKAAESKLKCSKCKRAFIGQSRLDLHMLKKHTAGSNTKGNHDCPICKKTFSHSACLTVHFRTHTGERPYKCRFCKKGFLDNSYLRKHEKIHLGDKPYKCKMCLKKYVVPSELKRHMKKVHSVI